LPAGFGHAIELGDRTPHIRLGIEVEQHAKRTREIHRGGGYAGAVANVADGKVTRQTLARQLHEARRIVDAGDSNSRLTPAQRGEKSPGAAAQFHDVHPGCQTEGRDQSVDHPLPALRIEHVVAIRHIRSVAAPAAFGLPDFLPIVLAGHEDG